MVIAISSPRRSVNSFGGTRPVPVSSTQPPNCCVDSVHARFCVGNRRHLFAVGGTVPQFVAISFRVFIAREFGIKRLLFLVVRSLICRTIFGSITRWFPRTREFRCG